jgi:hypothetical protein
MHRLKRGENHRLVAASIPIDVSNVRALDLGRLHAFTIEVIGQLAENEKPSLNKLKHRCAKEWFPHGVL